MHQHMRRCGKRKKKSADFLKKTLKKLGGRGKRGEGIDRGENEERQRGKVREIGRDKVRKRLERA